MNYNTLVKKESFFLLKKPTEGERRGTSCLEEYQIINKEEVTELEKNCFATNDCNSQFR